MRGDKVVRVGEAEALGERFEGEPLRGVAEGHGVAIGVHNNAAAVGDPHKPRHGGVCGHFRQRAQGGLFDCEEFRRRFSSFLVDTHVGD